MLVRAVLRGELPEPKPPQLMCEACGQLDRRPGGRCSECHCSVDELEGCLVCGQMLCERCYPTSQHRQCYGPRGPNTSKPEHAVLFGLPPCCVPHASRLGRTMMSKMANEHPVAADWPPEPPHVDDVSKWTAIDRCQSCSNTRDRCFRGIQCDDCGEKPPHRPCLFRTTPLHWGVEHLLNWSNTLCQAAYWLRCSQPKPHLLTLMSLT